MPGGHSKDRLSRALELRIAEITRRGSECVVKIVVGNKGAGHNVPTGMPTRQVVLRTEIVGTESGSQQQSRSYGAVVQDKNGKVLDRDSDVMLTGARLASDTRLRPSERRTETFKFTISPDENIEVRSILAYRYAPLGSEELAVNIDFAERHQESVCSSRGADLQTGNNETSRDESGSVTIGLRRNPMKRILSFACLAVLIVGATAAWMQSPQPKPYKVVFDLTSSDPLDQRAVMRWIKEVSGLNPKNEMEVVMYGRGLDLVISGKSTMTAEIAEALKTANVKFNVCAIAMKNQQVEKSQLLPNVQTVPDGIGEIVAKQNAGWGYIKVGH